MQLGTIDRTIVFPRRPLVVGLSQFESSRGVSASKSAEDAILSLVEAGADVVEIEASSARKAEAASVGVGEIRELLLDVGMSLFETAPPDTHQVFPPLFIAVTSIMEHSAAAIAAGAEMIRPKHNWTEIAAVAATVSATLVLDGSKFLEAKAGAAGVAFPTAGGRAAPVPVLVFPAASRENQWPDFKSLEQPVLLDLTELGNQTAAVVAQAIAGIEHGASLVQTYQVAEVAQAIKAVWPVVQAEDPEKD